MSTAVVSAPIALADWLRRRWLRVLGGLARPIVRHREFRVALMFSAVIVTALAGSLLVPLWLLILGPLVWGVPHLVADLRYLVVRTGYHRRPLLGLVAGLPLMWLALGGGLVWGFVGACGVALVARADLLPRAVAFAVLVACAASMLALGRTADVVFAHAHNFVAVGVWWLWRPRLGRAHWIPLALLIAATMFLLGGPALQLVHAAGGLDWFGADMGPDYQLWRLAPDLEPGPGRRLVLLFCFAQTIHYALWLQLIPDEDRDRPTPTTFRASHESLRADLGDVGLIVAAMIAVGIAAWALVDLTAANHGYFRMARFHGHLEIMAGTLLLLEGRLRTGSTTIGSSPRGGTGPRPT